MAYLRSTLLMLVALVALVPASAFSKEPSTSPSYQLDAGAQLALQVFARPDGIDTTSDSTMTLTLASGIVRQRTLTTYQRDVGDNEQVLIRFRDPASIRDTGLLVDTAYDGMWLFLPALDRVRRISSSNRGGRFVQSQVYYEDLQLRHPREDRHRLLDDDLYQGIPTKVLESVAIDASGSVYTKRVSWIHPETLVPLRIEFYEGEDTPSKRFEVLRLDEIQGYWTVTDSLMTDLERGDSTQITVNSIQYDTGLPESLFSTSALANPAADPALPEN
jgi:hypothetical protein